MLTLEQCSEYLQNAQVRAFLRCIREGESGQDDSAYRIINGGAHFDAPPWAHPWHGIPTTKGAKASGAYQFLGTTWGRIADAWGLGGDDFTPGNQDAGAVYLIEGRGALQAVLDGDLVKACSLLRDEWVALPQMGLQRLQRVFLQYGGTLTPGAEVSQAPPPPKPKPQQPAQPAPPEAPMPLPILGLIAAFGPIIAELIPQLKTIFKPGSEVAQRNTAIAEVAIKTITEAAKAPNIQSALEEMQAKPEVLQAVTEAVVTNPTIMPLIEVGGGIPEARKAAAAIAESPNWWRVLLAPSFIVSLVLLGLVWFVAWNMLLGNTDLWRAEDRSQILMLAVAITSGVMGFYLGSSLGSQKKDDAAIATARQQ